ncbi:MAG: serine hydroxymethyltransferase [Acidobacteria bacterium]|nr:serine hydroxymethyltransferase [Acidobacteriota bacterium]
MSDDEVTSLLADEWARQTTTVQLIASENFTSPAVMAATGSIMTNKYAEGYPGRRYYGGNQVVDEMEDLARRRLTALFGADHANVQPHSGANANVAVYQALLQPGDTILAMRLDQGGHLTHGSPASITSKIWNFVSYGVTPRSDDPEQPGEIIDVEQLRRLAHEHRPKLIVAGATAYSRLIDPAMFREIADEVGALLMFDSAHPAGLIAGGSHPNPAPYADAMTFTTHKTLRGPRGGAILCREEHAKKIDGAVFPGQQGGPLEHAIAAKAVAFREASQPAFSAYTDQVVANARAFARALQSEGFRVVSNGTDNHQVIVDLRDFDAELTGKEAQEVLDRAGITTNRNQIPDDPRSPFVTSGLRLGTPAETTAGMREGEFASIATLMARALRDRANETSVETVRNDIAELCSRFNPYAHFTG